MKKKISESLFILFIAFLLPSTSSASDPTGTWSSTEALPYSVASNASEAVNGKLFVINGSSQTGYSKSYASSATINSDGTVQDWSTSSSANTPTALIFHSSTKKDSNIYILGGTNEVNQSATSVDTVYLGQVDTSGDIDSWSSLNAMPAKLSLGAAVISGDYIYYGGGGTWTNGSGPTLTDKMYYAAINSDGTIGSWSETTALPSARYGHSLIASDGYLILVGGGSPASKDVYAASINSDGTLGSWSAQTSLPKALHRSGVARVGNQIIAVGGFDGSNMLTDVYYTDLTDGLPGDWTKSDNSLPAVTCCGAIAVYNGYAYLSGGYGTGYKNTVYMSKVGESTAALTPIIFFPGMGGSWNYEALMHGATTADTDWSMTPFVTIYDGLINSLVSAGYTKNQDLWIYNYDWRKNISTTASNLASFIDTKVPSGQVNLIGHSQGGLVARIYTQNNASKVNKIITVGSPHAGAATIYRIWEGADFSGSFPNWQSLLLKLYLRTQRGSYDNEVVQIQSLFPNMLGVWPTFDFLKPTTTTPWSNNLTLSSIDSQLNTVSGAGVNTTRYLNLTTRTTADALAGKWKDGKPSSEEYADGDGTVLTSSSKVTTAAATAELTSSDHGQIVSKAAAQQQILDLLGLTGTTADASQDSLDQAILVSVASPATFTVSDGSTTYSPTDGLVVINNAASGNYSVNLVGTGNGNYTVYFGRTKNTDIAWEEKTGSITTGGTATQTFVVDFTKASLGANPIATALARIDSAKLSIPSTSLLQQDLARIKFYLNDLKSTAVKTSSDFDTRMSRLYSLINTTVAKSTTLAPYLRLIKQDILQERGDRFGN